LEQRFAYDAENHLIRAATYRDGNLVSEGRYHYDSLGRRIAKVVEQDGATRRTDFLWQGLRLLEERSGDAQKLYLYEPDSYAPLARVDGAGEDARLYYFHTDHIGTPLDVTDEDGQMVWQASYKAWGEVEAYHTQAIEQNLRFQGQYFDAETGLHYNTFRYYDPGVGRFVTQDPIGLLGGNNLYQYAPNALGWIDPLGWAGNPATATHITYQGIDAATGKPYVGYASMQGNKVGTDVLNYRYGSDFSRFGGQAPEVIYEGYGQSGKDTARGLEQRIFEKNGGLEGGLVGNSLSAGQRETVFVYYRELVHRRLPLAGGVAPFGSDIAQGQPDQLGGRFVAGKVAAGLDDLA
jgi:RHS repeat-associated protein